MTSRFQSSERAEQNFRLGGSDVRAHTLNHSVFSTSETFSHLRASLSNKQLKELRLCEAPTNSPTSRRSKPGRKNIFKMYCVPCSVPEGHTTQASLFIQGVELLGMCSLLGGLEWGWSSWRLIEAFQVAFSPTSCPHTSQRV